MSNLSRIILFVFWGVFLVACQTVNIPKPYDFKPREIKENVYGCWINVKYNFGEELQVPTQVAGELICIDSDTIYVLEGDRIVRPVFSGTVSAAVLYTHKNQGDKYGKLTLLFLAPNFLGTLFYLTEYGGSFLALGLPIAVVGFTQAIIEGGSSKYILRYPEKKKLDDLKNYARFPAGKPPGIDFGQLMLKVAY